MELWQHTVISAAGSGAIYAVTGSLPAAAAFSATGIFVDLDHIPDYWRDHGFNLNLKPFFAHFDRKAPETLWLVLHGWEWPIAGLILGSKLGWPAWLLGAVGGWLLHLSLDQIFNRFQPMGYWFWYRARAGFESRKFIR